MCGIAGCVGHHEAVNFVTGGLEGMDERGYDSAGVAYLNSETSRLEIIREVGAVSKLLVKIPEDAHKASAAIGHTRWATHGEKTVENAHPHPNSDRTIAVVENGIILNYQDLKNDLESQGYKFESETDTEVVPHLLDHYVREGSDPDEAFYKTIRRLEGAYAILAYFASEPDTIYAVRHGSNPLIMGVRGDERFIASMRDAIRPYTRWMDRMERKEMARLSADGRKYRTWDLEGRATTRSPQKDSGEIENADKGDFEHWMIKEIHEGPETVRAALRGRVLPDRDMVRLGGLEDPEIQERLEDINKIFIVACGTSYNAGMIGKKLIQELAGIPVEVQFASEFQHNEEILNHNTAVIAISQSGETSDTLGALQKAKDKGLLTLGINNSPGSEMEAITDAGVHCNARKERSVASTKAYISQVTVLAEMGLALSNERTALHHDVLQELTALPEKMEQILANKAAIETAAKKYAQYKNFLFLGRGYEHVTAMEGSLKLKEISYIHAEALPTAEMKHGHIALIDEEFPTFAIATDSPVYEKTVSGIQEIKSRKGPVIALATQGNDSIKDIADDVLFVPASMEQTQPILNAVVMQLFAYYVAAEKGLEIDRPRNLAKSVTVE